MAFTVIARTQSIYYFTTTTERSHVDSSTALALLRTQFFFVSVYSPHHVFSGFKKKKVKWDKT